MKKLLYYIITLLFLDSCSPKNAEHESKTVCDSVTEKKYKFDTLIKIDGVYKRIISDTILDILVDEEGNQVIVTVVKYDTIVVE